MTVPRTIWNYSLETEIDRLIQVGTQTANHFYSKFGFLVLPYLVKNNGKTVYFPDLDWQPAFFNTVKRLALDIPMPANSQTRQQTEQKINQSGYKLKTNPLQIAWALVEKPFWNYLNNLFPSLIIKSVEIRLTGFGSLCSFNLFSPSQIKIYVRLDADVSRIAEAILSAIFSTQIEKEGYSWTEKEAVIDFLFLNTKLKTIFPNYDGTLQELRKNQLAKLVLDSQKYLSKLGIITENIFIINNNQLLIDRQSAKLNLTKTEQEIFFLLIKQKNQFCSFDELAKIIWQNQADEKFSYWAIAKTMQRIRNKIADFGLSPEIIQTKRGEGYLLRD